MPPVCIYGNVCMTHDMMCKTEPSHNSKGVILYNIQRSLSHIFAQNLKVRSMCHLFSNGQMLYLHFHINFITASQTL